MAKKKQLTTRESIEQLKIALGKAKKPQFPLDFEEAMKIVIDYNPKEGKKKKGTKK